MFNKKELLSTYSHEKQTKVCNVLWENGIGYEVSTAGTAVRNIGSGWVATNRFGREDNTEYRVYVKKKEYGRALELIDGMF